MSKRLQSSSIQLSLGPYRLCLFLPMSNLFQSHPCVGSAFPLRLLKWQIFSVRKDAVESDRKRKPRGNGATCDRGWDLTCRDLNILHVLWPRRWFILAAAQFWCVPVKGATHLSLHVGTAFGRHVFGAGKKTVTLHNMFWLKCINFPFKILLLDSWFLLWCCWFTNVSFVQFMVSLAADLL